MFKLVIRRNQACTENFSLKSTGLMPKVSELFNISVFVTVKKVGWGLKSDLECLKSFYHMFVIVGKRISPIELVITPETDRQVTPG